jgi:hypothetical protein
MLRRIIARTTGGLMLAVFLAITAGCVAPGGADKPCGANPSKDYKLKIQTIVVNGTVTPTGVNHGDGTSANLLHTCPSDTVKWELKDYEFVIAFDKGTDSPFSWTSKNATNDGANNWSAQGSILSTAPRKAYLEYSIQIVNGGKLDPVIIVER